MTAAGLRAVGYSLGSAGAAALTIAGVLHTAVGLLGIAGLGFAGVLSLLCGFGFARDAWLKDRKAATTRRLMASGLFGTATVTGLEQASYWSQENPKCRIRLNVAVPGRAVYQATIDIYITISAMPRYQPGCSFPVLVDPDDLSAVTFVVSQPYNS
jgi:hypothetical protein